MFMKQKRKMVFQRHRTIDLPSNPDVSLKTPEKSTDIVIRFFMLFHCCHGCVNDCKNRVLSNDSSNCQCKHWNGRWNYFFPHITSEPKLFRMEEYLTMDFLYICHLGIEQIISNTFDMYITCINIVKSALARIAYPRQPYGQVRIILKISRTDPDG